MSTSKSCLYRKNSAVYVPCPPKYDLCTAILLLSVYLCAPTGASDADCGTWEIEGNRDSGRLLSPNYPFPYPGNVTCDWVVVVNDSLNLEFTIIFLSSAAGDSLSVYLEYPQSGTIPRWTFGDHTINGTKFSTDRTVYFELISSGPIGTASRVFEIAFISNLPVHMQCDEIREVLNGDISSTNLSINSVVRFSCNEGYILHGPHSIKCEEKENSFPEWSSDPPTCISPCIWDKGRLGQNGSFYDVPSNINVILSPNYPNSILGPVSCAWQVNAINAPINLTIADVSPIHPPYNLEIWNNKATDFLDPTLLQNLVVNKTTLQEPLSFSISGNAVTIILRTKAAGSSGRFRININKISVVTCAQPPALNYITSHPQQSVFNVGDVVTYHCVGTFVYVNQRNVTNICSASGEWSNTKPATLPTCGADCRGWSPERQAYIPLVISDIQGTLYSKGYPLNIPPGECKYTFLAGSQEVYIFDFVSANLTSTIVSIVELIGENEWVTYLNSSSEYISKTSSVMLTVNQSAEYPVDKFILNFRKQFVEIKCNEPEVTNHLEWTNGSFEIGSNVNFTCRGPFDIFGSSRSTCVFFNTTTAIWSPDIPICIGSCGGAFVTNNITIVSPGYPRTYRNTQHSRCQWNVINTHNDQLQISIPEINLSTNDNLTIYDSKEVFFDSDTCRVNCSWFSALTDADIITIDFMLEIDDNNRHDGVLRRFAIDVVSLSLITCGSPAPLHNGEVLGNDYREGSIVRFICHPPYDLNGPTFSMCIRSPEGSLHWGHSGASCLIPDCTPPSAVKERFAGTGAVASPGYPESTIKGGQECVWKIESTQSNSQVVLQFTYLELPGPSQDGRLPSVLIYDVGGNKLTLLANFTHGSPLRNITSRTDAVRVEYYGPERNTQGYRGLYLKYSILQIPIITTRLSTSKISTSTSTITTTHKVTKGTSKLISKSTKTPTKSSSSPTTIESRVTTTEKDTSTQTLDQMAKPTEGNTGSVVAGVVVTILLVTVSVIVFYVWYRRKYPVRMILGKHFGKFANPVYEKGASTLTLVREDTPANPIPEKISETNPDVKL